MMSDRVDIVLSVEAGDWSVLGDADSLCRRAVEAALAAAEIGATGGAIGVALATDAELRDLNRTWRGQDKPTNVLSFPSGEKASDQPGAPPPHYGDVILAFETVAREAREQGKSLSDHTTHLLVHGVLHLFGYDHEADDEAEIMERLETRILAGIGIADPYLETAA
jgi:probable rRNA maturation factor